MSSELAPEERALIDALAPAELARNGIPSADEAARRRAAHAEAARVLEPWLASAADLRVSVLGPEWSSDIDAHVSSMPPADVLRSAGWLPLDRLGYPGRWAVVADGAVVGGLDLVTGPRPSPVDSVLDRCRRRGEVRVRDILEIRVLERAGATVPAGDDVVVAAAAIERALRQRDGSGGGEAPVPNSIRGGARVVRVRSIAGRLRRAVRRKPVVAFSGVDGSGKSSLTSGVRAALEVAGVPATIVWARPGMNLGPLSRVAKAARRAVGQGDEPGVRTVASGASDQLPSRRGALGALWVTLVGVMFAIDVRRQHAAARGVVLYDRHLLDAFVTLDFVYGGAWLGAAKLLARLALPKPDAAFYVDVPADVAVSRKPGDTFGRHAVVSQLELYERLAHEVPGLRRLDGTDAPESLVQTVVRSLTAPAARTA